MKHLASSLAFIAVFIMTSVAAWADHMNGTYSGTGEAAGVNLQIVQNGRTVTGQFTGAARGTLSGQSDGGDNAAGTADIETIGQMQFQLRWSQQKVDLTLIGTQGSLTYAFAAGGAPTPPTPQPPSPPAPPPPPPPPPPPVSDVQYFLLENGATVGPFSFDQVRARLGQGASSPEDLIWKEGMPAWARIDSLAEFQAAPPAPPPPPPGPTPPPPPPPAGGGGGGSSPGFPGRSSD